MTSARQRTAAPAWRLLPIAIILVGLVVGYVFGLHHYLTLDWLVAQRMSLEEYVAEHRLWSAILFVISYILAVAFSFPAASILTIFGGFLFGWKLGGALVAISATLGASILFLATRSAFGGFLRQRAKGFTKRFADGFEQNAFAYLVALRLAPIFPFFAVNIAAALFDISLGRFMAATFIGILPVTFAYTYLGQGVESILVAAQASGRQVHFSDLVTKDVKFALAALALVAVIPVIAKLLRKRSRSS
ncbi:Uncharacterized membrane protein YdjX, TVP38/TMEM64 family, SNARE-associated domain [Rhizobium sp. RU36D]|nr:Uncharacterized membrane protein YdjX, TVP38/TMEM64 family, SNARE-associated domain [Rhizobium sp. RU36D]